MYEPKKLILAVEKQQVLWNSSHNDYHNRDMNDLAWHEVCCAVRGDYLYLDMVERKRICAEIKKKWFNIRDCYRRDLQKNRSTTKGLIGKNHKRYIFADMLSFLTPVLQNIKSLEAKNYIDQEGDQYEGAEDEFVVNEIQERTMDGSQIRMEESQIRMEESQIRMEGSQTRVEGKNRSQIRRPSRRKRQRERQSNKIDVMSEILNIIKENDKTDDDMNFLLSFRRDLRALNSRQKLDFKIGMLELMKNILKNR